VDCTGLEARRFPAIIELKIDGVIKFELIVDMVSAVTED
jgi:hypothetical protein